MHSIAYLDGVRGSLLADALALTFAYEVVPSDHRFDLIRRPVHQIEYHPFANVYREARQSVRNYPSFGDQGHPYQGAYRK